MGYKADCVTISHVGYERETSKPCILVIAPDFSNADAAAVVEFVQTSPERRVIVPAFFFEGTFEEFNINTGILQEYHQRPQPGSSIGSSALPKCVLSIATSPT